ncbi:MAG: SDR family NAD(P)-dependent oxidoreductase [Gemmatimonadales bacterium]
MRLEDKVVLITGAGSGMGKVTALLFAREGAKIVATDIVDRALERTVAEVRAAGGQVVAVRGDVARAADIERAVQEGVRAFGKLDVLYNNAGIFPDEDTSVVDTDEQMLDRVLSINLKGVFLCCKYGVPALLAARGGAIVNIASFVALMGCTVPQDAYTASKGGVLALTRSLAVQYGRHNIRANAICPGPIETPLLQTILSDPAKRALRLNRIPLGRFGRAEDVAYAGLYLASDESAWVTGTTFVVDGGITVNYF